MNKPKLFDRLSMDTEKRFLLKLRVGDRVKSIRNNWGTIEKIAFLEIRRPLDQNYIYSIRFDNGNKNLFGEMGKVFRCIHPIPAYVEYIIDYKKMR